MLNHCATSRYMIWSSFRQTTELGKAADSCTTMRVCCGCHPLPARDLPESTPADEIGRRVGGRGFTQPITAFRALSLQAGRNWEARDLSYPADFQRWPDLPVLTPERGGFIHDLVQPIRFSCCLGKSCIPPGSSRYQPSADERLVGRTRPFLPNAQARRPETVCFSVTEYLQLNRHQPEEPRRL